MWVSQNKIMSKFQNFYFTFTFDGISAVLKKTNKKAKITPFY